MTSRHERRRRSDTRTNHGNPFFNGVTATVSCPGSLRPGQGDAMKAGLLTRGSLRRLGLPGFPVACSNRCYPLTVAGAVTACTVFPLASPAYAGEPTSVFMLSRRSSRCQVWLKPLSPQSSHRSTSHGCGSNWLPRRSPGSTPPPIANAYFRRFGSTSSHGPSRREPRGWQQGSGVSCRRVARPGITGASKSDRGLAFICRGHPLPRPRTSLPEQLRNPVVAPGGQG